MKSYSEQLENAIRILLNNDIRMNNIVFNLKLYTKSTTLVIITDVPPNMTYEKHEQNIRDVIKDLFNITNLKQQNHARTDTFDFNLNFANCDLSKVNKIMTFQ